MLKTAPASRLADGAAASPFVWKDFGRFVEVAPVERGWLVLWGTYRDSGRTRQSAGNRTYANLEGARRRIADAVFELTRDLALVDEAVVRFDRTPFPARSSDPLPEPL